MERPPTSLLRSDLLATSHQAPPINENTSCHFIIVSTFSILRGGRGSVQVCWADEERPLSCFRDTLDRINRLLP